MIPAPRSAGPPLRAVLIGLGSRGGDWLAALASPEAEALGVHLVGLGDPDPDRALGALARVGRALPIASDIHQVLALAPDLVVDAGGPGTRLAVAQAALLAGTYVLCEPPLAHDADTATALLGAARGSGRLAVAHRTRYLVGARQLRALVKSAELGLAVTLSAKLHEDRGHRDAGAAPAFLQDPAPHAFDAARMILGSEAVEVRCVEGPAASIGAPVCSGGVHVKVEMSCGAVFTIAVNPREAGASTAPAGGWRLVLNDGVAEWGGEGLARAWRAGGGPPTSHPLNVPSETQAGLLACLAEAVTALRDPHGSSRRGVTRDAAASLAISLAAMRSARSGGRPEAVRPLDPAADLAPTARWASRTREAS